MAGSTNLLIFGHEVFPLEADGNYIAYTPMFNRLPSPLESKYVEIVFFRSLNYHDSKNYIIGFYASPQIGTFHREANHIYYKKYDFGNVKALSKNISLFQTPIVITNEIVLKENYLPLGKKLGQQGYNYLTEPNVLKLLDKATILNPNDQKIKSIKYRLLSGKK